ncbi:M48 family metallopeptidase [Thalassotalea ganghwensis]
MVQYELIRSDRKSLALKVINGKVIIRAPFYTSQDYIDAIVAKRKSWIEQVTQKQAQQLPLQNFLTHNGRLWLWGRLHRLVILESKQSDIIIDDETVTLCIKSSTYQRIKNNHKLNIYIKKTLEQWFAKQAELVILPKVEKLSQQVGLYPKTVNIRQFKARWGSCDNFGKIQFNYLLLMVPDWVIDYVVVHELCHLKHLNHSRKFWQLVAQHYSNVEQAKKWLNLHQAKLIWQGVDALNPFKK